MDSGDDDVADGDGHARTGGPVEAGFLELVQGLRDEGHRVVLGQIVDDAGLHLLRQLLVDERVARRQQLVEEHATQRGADRPGVARLPVLRQFDARGRDDAVQPDVDRRADRDLSTVQRHQRLGRRGVRTQLACGFVQFAVQCVMRADCVLVEPAQVVQTGDEVQRRHGQRLAGRRGQDVVAREHQHPRLGLRLGGQRQVDRHLVTVEVGVERGTDQRVQLDGLALDQHRLEGLDAQPVQGRVLGSVARGASR